MPIINGKKNIQINLIEAMISVAEKKMPSVVDANQKKEMARLAYHLGESFRIGGGMDTFF